MLHSFKRFNSFAEVSKAHLAVVFLLNFAEAFFAVSGLALLYPLIRFLQVGKETFVNDIGQSSLKYIEKLSDFLGIEISLGFLVICAVLPLLLQQMFRFLKEYVAIQIQNNSVCRMQRKLINSMFSVDVEFFSRTQLGELGNAATTATFRAGLTIQQIINYFSSILIGTVYFIVMLVISWKLTLVSVLIIGLIPLLTNRQSHAIRQRSRLVESINRDLHAYLIDRLRSIKRMLLSNMSDVEMDYFSRMAQKREKTIVHTLTLISLINNTLEPAMMAVALAIIFVGVKVIHIEYAVLFLFLYIVTKTKPAINSVVKSKNQALIYMRSFDVVEDVYRRISSATTIKNGTKELNKLEKYIKIDKLTFAYDKKDPLFDNLSVSFMADQTTALVGRSGSGKTTLLDLILRFREPQSGSIMFDDTELKEIKLESLRSRIGMLSQDIMLFHGTIIDNITYGLKNLTEDQVRNACRMAHVDDFVEHLQEGYESHIGECGAKLSGGQKQRLALAHIFLKNPEIIILDEPTSALDGETELIIKNAIDKMKGTKTIIIVAHRLSTIRNSDDIIVLDSGRVLSRGTFDKLMEESEEFRKMVKYQQI